MKLVRDGVRWDVKTNWKRCLLEVGNWDQLDFRVDVWAIQLPWRLMMSWFLGKTSHTFLVWILHVCLVASGPCLRVSVILFVSLPSLRIITSGRQISTVSIVGRSVYLLTRKDSLCYNRLISLTPRALISSQLKIETIIAVCKVGGRREGAF